MRLKFIVSNQTLVIHPSQAKLRLVADSKHYVVAQFDFRTEEWETKPVFALFTFEDKTYKMVLGADSSLEWNECWVPEEVIQSPRFSVSLYCGDRVTTNVVAVNVDNSGYTTKIVNQRQTQTVAEQIDALMRRYALICNSILQDCDKIREELKGGKQ